MKKTVRYHVVVPVEKFVAIHCAHSAWLPVSCTSSVGRKSNEEAKMTGMTPAMLTLSGM